MRPFVYPAMRHVHIHAPAGYTSYKSYKEWLRDEFEFRCVYCLTREKWHQAGSTLFGVDHVLAKGNPDYDQMICVYENLVYCCNQCNSSKGVSQVLDPRTDPLGSHVEIHESGELRWLSKEGERLVRKLKLNALENVRSRRRLLAYWRLAFENPESDYTKLYREYFQFPDDLPNLSRFQPPENGKPDGVENCHFERRKRGELPEVY